MSGSTLLQGPSVDLIAINLRYRAQLSNENVGLYQLDTQSNTESSGVVALPHIITEEFTTFNKCVDPLRNRSRVPLKGQRFAGWKGGLRTLALLPLNRKLLGMMEGYQEIENISLGLSVALQRG